MKNLAGNEHADTSIRSELTRCGIEIVESDARINHPDVKSHLSGKLGPFTFYRNWYYWVVNGPVPLDVAEKLYADPVGKTDIRVGGHCGCPSPHEYGTTFYDAEGLELIHDPDGKQEKEWDEFAEKHPDWKEFSPESKAKYHFVPDRKAVAVRGIVDTYHIDSELGLYIFVQALKEEGLDK